MTALPELLKIGDFARATGTNLRTLRYYEELGILQPALRSDGGFRYYRPTDARRVRLIHDLQELGLPLDRIRELLDTRAVEGGRERWVRHVQGALSEQRRLVDEHIRSLEEQRAKISAAQAKLALCRTCEHTPAADNNYCEPCQRTGEPLPELLSGLF